MLNIKTRVKDYINKMIAESLPGPVERQTYPAVDILLGQHGYAKTVEAKLPLSADGLPIPWYTYPAIEYFNQLNAKGLKVFEYGSGNSSLYWAHKGAEVWSVEHDPDWYENMKSRSAQLKGLFLKDTPQEYASAITSTEQDFDLIIIDGAWRNECANIALAHLRPNGLIILDNSDWYTDVSAFLKSNGFFQVDFNGFGPINNYCWTTSILLPFKSALTEIMGHPQPIGGIEASKSDKW